MRGILDEATVRRIVRESVVRRMLFEAEGDSPPPTIPGLADLFGVGSDEDGTAAGPGQTLGDLKKSAGSGKPLSKFEPKSDETTLDAIMRIATERPTAKAELDRDGDEYFGPKTGEAVKAYIEKMAQKSVKSDFKPTDSGKVMEQWRLKAPYIKPIPIMGEDGSEQGELNFTPDEVGLLAYLVALQLVLFGRQVTRAEYEDATGIIEEVKPTAEALLAIFDKPVLSWYITDNNLRQASYEILNFIEQKDQEPSLQKTKALLAYFASQNTTATEAWKTTGLVTAIVAGIAAVVVGGAVLAGVGAGAAGLGGATGIGGGATGIAGATAATGAIATGSGWIAATLSGAGHTILPLALAGLSAIAAKGLIATGAASAAGIVAGAFATNWCGNRMIEYSDEYLEFKAALMDRSILGELRGEFEDTWSMGSSETNEIANPVISALTKIETSNSSSNIRNDVLYLLQQSSGSAVLGGR